MSRVVLGIHLPPGSGEGTASPAVHTGQGVLELSTLCFPPKESPSWLLGGLAALGLCLGRLPVHLVKLAFIVNWDLSQDF